MTVDPAREKQMLEAISLEILGVYGERYDVAQTSAATYLLNDSVVVCVLEDILTANEQAVANGGGAQRVIDGRVGFQRTHQDEFVQIVEKLTRRRVVGFLSANQTSPGVAAELFFLGSTGERSADADGAGQASVSLSPT